MFKKRLLCLIISLFMCLNIVNAKTIILKNNSTSKIANETESLSVAQNIAESFSTTVSDVTDERPVQRTIVTSRTQGALILFPSSISSGSAYEYAYMNDDGGSSPIYTPKGKWNVEVFISSTGKYTYKMGTGYHLSDCNGTSRLKKGAVYYFHHGGYSNVKVDTTNINNNRIEIDRETKKKYTATTLYFRYLFDIIDGSKNPLHDLPGWDSGPYSLYDIELNFSGAFDTGLTVSQARANPSAYMTDIKPDIPYNVAQKDRGDDVNINSPNNNAIFQKYEEYRRYLTPIASGSQYSYVYGYEKQSFTDYTEDSHYQPSGSVSVDTKYVYDANGARTVSGYTISASVVGLTTSKTYTNNPALYDKSNVNSTEFLNEPAENQGDLWHNITSAEIRIHKPGEEATESNIIYKKSIPILDNKGSLILNLDALNMPTELKGYNNLNMAKVTLKTIYDENIRMMTNKTVVTDLYKINTSDISYTDYSSIINYINALSTTQYANKTTSNVTDFHNDTLNTIRTFRTITSLRNAILAQDTIEVGPAPITPSSINITPNDPTPLLVTVSVNPPNSTTKLEGGKFDVSVNVSEPKDSTLTSLLKDAVPPYAITYSQKSPQTFGFSPIGLSEENEWSYTTGMPLNPTMSNTEWYTDFKITNLKIIAENGTTIFDSSNAEDKAKMPADASVKNFTVPNLTANPDQVGKATITVTYTYNHHQRYMSEITTSTDVDVNGNPLIINRTYQTKVDGLCGQAQATMNIYSLTGETVN